jgi:hypothetical protein
MSSGLKGYSPRSQEMVFCRSSLKFCGIQVQGPELASPDNCQADTVRMVPPPGQPWDNRSQVRLEYDSLKVATDSMPPWPSASAKEVAGAS